MTKYDCMKSFVRDNLVECCKEFVEHQAAASLPPGGVLESAAAMIDPIPGIPNQEQVRFEVEWGAYELIANGEFHLNWIMQQTCNPERTITFRRCISGLIELTLYNDSNSYQATFLGCTIEEAINAAKLAGY